MKRTVNSMLATKACTAPLYTPAQTFTAALLGGPMAAAWTLSRNFRAVSRDQAGLISLLGGLVGCVIVAIIGLKYSGYFTVYHIPPYVVPAVYSGGFLALGHVYFAETVTAHIQLGGTKRSWWAVAGVTIVGLCILSATAGVVHRISPAVDFL